MKNEDKRAEEIVEETMKAISDDIEKEDAQIEETEDSETLVETLEGESEEAESEEAELKEEELEVEESEEVDSEEEDSDEKDLEVDFDDDSDIEYLKEDDFEDKKSEGEEDSEEESEETEAEKAYRKHKFRKKAAIISGSILGALIVIYLGFALYFGSHFMFYTKINGKDFAMKNVSQVEAYMEQQVVDYELALETSNNKDEKIVGKDIDLTYVPGDELKKQVKQQDNFLWLKTLWDHPELNVAVGVKYDKDKLAGVVGKLACMQEENQTPSVNAYPELKGDRFEITPEVIGTQIDVEKFNTNLAEAINGFQAKLNLLDSGSYMLPAFVSDSEEVIKAEEAMNSYLGAEVTYDFNPATEVVNAAVIGTWVKVDDNMQVTFDQEAVKAYIAGLAEKYDTKGKPRTFTTATGNSVTVEGGHYGWQIDQEKEYETLTANVANAEIITREPEYSSRAASHGPMDVGSTYAEVDLTNQKAYFIKDGQVVLESDVVTGNPNRGNATPQGTYSLTYKTRNAVLRGEKRPDGTYSYESPVSYWMPFNRGIGFHDATWQSSFGGSRYKSHGSHGCVNMPKDKARQMYELISDGIPVVCHY